MWTVLSGLLGFLSGPLTSISNDLKEAYRIRENAKNDAERIASEERIQVLEAQKTTILAAQSDPIERWIRVGFALPFVIYINKLVIWDKVLSLGVTDPLSQELSHIMMIVLGGYFIDTIVRRVTKR